MTPPPPSRAFLAAQIRWVRGRGIPVQEAEDLVFEAYHKAVKGFDPRRGAFEAYMQSVVRSMAAYWWRRHGRTQRAHDRLRLLPDDADRSREEAADRHQTALLEALDPDERRIFAAWALQKHLGKGQITSVDVAESLGIGVNEYENAKRRLKAQLGRLLARFGWTARTVLYGEDDVEQTG